MRTAARDGDADVPATTGTTRGNSMTSALHRQDSAALAHTDVLVLDYLAALWAVTDDLPPGQRDVLMNTVADYIARRRVGTQDGAERILTLLGPVEDIAAAARRGRLPVHLIPPVAPPMPPAPTTAAAGAVEWTGVTLLTAGAVVLPLVGPLAGMLLVSSSARWTQMQKVAAWLLAGVPAAFGVLLLLMLFVSRDEVALVAAYLLMVAGPMTAGLTLVPGLFTRRSAAGR
jgi:hypothetical protein